MPLEGLALVPGALPTIDWPRLVAAAAIDSVNPCAFGVLIFLITYLLKVTNSPRKMIVHGLTYIVAVYITYFAAGLLLLNLISNLKQYTVPFYILFGAIVLVAGVLEFRDFVRGQAEALMAIRPSMKKRVEAMVMRISDHKWMSAGLGFFVAMVELPCTGAVYVGVLTMMSVAPLDVNNWMKLVVYNLIFVAPLVVILVSVHRGMTTMEFKKLYVRAKRWMRLGIALLLVAMGVWMLENAGFWNAVYELVFVT